MLNFKFTFLKEGPCIIIKEGRFSYGIGSAVVGHTGGNGGQYMSLPPTSLTQFTLGPCLVERKPWNDTRLLLHEMGQPWSDAANLLSPDGFALDCYRYTLLDGQRVIWIQTPLGIDHALLVQDNYAASDYPHWRQEFPESAWD